MNSGAIRGLLYKGTNPIHDPIASQRPHLLIPSYWRLGSNIWIGGGGGVTQSQSIAHPFQKIALLNSWPLSLDLRIMMLQVLSALLPLVPTQGADAISSGVASDHLDAKCSLRVLISCPSFSPLASSSRLLCWCPSEEATGTLLFVHDAGVEGTWISASQGNT